MNLRSKIMIRLHSLFRITELQSWSRVSAADILSVPDVGKSTLNKLRLHLAHRGIVLRGDNPPAYWLEILGQPKPEPGECAAGICPFTIVIDTNETYPFAFDSIFDDKDQRVVVSTMRSPLYLSGLADYTIKGFEQDIAIERKADDLESSMSERRDIFEQELSRLNDCCQHAWVVVEKQWSEILGDDHRHGARARSVSRTVISWQVKYPGVQWWFCAGRYHAEQVAFRLLEKAWWNLMRSSASEALSDVLTDLCDPV